MRPREIDIEGANSLVLLTPSHVGPDAPEWRAFFELVRRVCATKSGGRSAIRLELGPTWTLGHEERLEHVIGHLVQNALDATSVQGDVVVRLATRNKQAMIEVCDTGAGMPAEFIRERLFKPFETTKSTGMGIGVYESLQYVRSLGGDLEVESVEGTGTTVRVLLPHSEGAPASADARAALGAQH